jgi:hypothetical protein
MAGNHWSARAALGNVRSELLQARALLEQLARTTETHAGHLCDVQRDIESLIKRYSRGKENDGDQQSV